MQSQNWTPEPAALRAVYEDFQTKNPKVRIRDAASALGVAEAQLVALGCDSGTMRLRPDWPALFARLEALGRVTAITRNESVVHEKHGVYANVEINPMHILVANPDIDLRLFPRAWAMAFAHPVTARDGVKQSLQIFDRHGNAVHKIFSTEGGDLAGFGSIAMDFAAEDQAPRQEVAPPPAPERELPDWAVDANALRAAWRGLQDTHDFFPLLKRLGLSRVQALRLAEPEFAWRVECSSVRKVLTRAAQQGLAIMVFVGNPGAIQIHTGPVDRVQDVGPWLNVLDAGFNLHLKEADVVDAWLVRKPSVDGVVTALECFDRDGRQIVQFFGKRKPGTPELEAWRTLAESLPRLAGPVPALA